MDLMLIIAGAATGLIVGLTGVGGGAASLTFILYHLMIQ